MFIAVPLVLFNLSKVRQAPIGLYWTSAVTIAGFMVHRMNVSINSLERATQAHYVPKWPEMAVTLMLVTAAVLAFRYAVLHLEIFPREVASSSQFRRRVYGSPVQTAGTAD